MKKISLFILLCVSAISFAQMANNKGSITGKIVDLEAENSPLAFATVEVVETNQKATTDLKGAFSFIGLDPGTYKLRVRFLGYEDFYTEELKVEADQIQNLSYSLKAIELN
jgi:hypothetical protein